MKAPAQQGKEYFKAMQDEAMAKVSAAQELNRKVDQVHVDMLVDTAGEKITRLHKEWVLDADMKAFDEEAACRDEMGEIIAISGTALGKRREQYRGC